MPETKKCLCGRKGIVRVVVTGVPSNIKLDEKLFCPDCLETLVAQGWTGGRCDDYLEAYRAKERRNK